MTSMPGPRDFAQTYVTPKTLDRELEEWMREISPYQWRKIEPFARGRIALLVIDMTRPFVDEDRPLSSPNARAVVPRVRALVEGFRRTKNPVLWLAQGHHSLAHDRGKRLSSWWPLPILEGTSDVEPASGLDVGKNEKVIIKRRYSGFFQTDLECTLRNLGMEQVVICGVLTHVCPYATAFDAFSRDFGVYYAADGTASLNRELHVAALRNIAGWCGRVMRVQDILARLKPGGHRQD